jgi:hypothetical protein
MTPEIRKNFIKSTLNKTVTAARRLEVLTEKIVYNLFNFPVETMTRTKDSKESKTKK